MRLIVASLLSLFLFACSTPQHRQPPVTDAELNGTWSIRKAELGGKNFSFPGFELQIQGTQYRAGAGTLNDQGKLVFFGDELQGENKRLDVVGESGPNAGKRYPAIYRLLANGREMEICYNLLQTDRPNEFVSREGTMLLRITYARK